MSVRKFYGFYLERLFKQFKYSLIDTINQDSTGWENYALKCLIEHPILRNIYFVMFIKKQEKLLMK